MHLWDHVNCQNLFMLWISKNVIFQPLIMQIFKYHKDSNTLYEFVNRYCDEDRYLLVLGTSPDIFSGFQTEPTFKRGKKADWNCHSKVYCKQCSLHTCWSEVLNRIINFKVARALRETTPVCSGLTRLVRAGYSRHDSGASSEHARIMRRAQDGSVHMQLVSRPAPIPPGRL